MPAPANPFEAVLNAARDVTELDCAFDAELLGGALLGSVYTVAEQDRSGAVRDFVARFLDATKRRRTATATTIRAVFATLVPEAAPEAEVGPAAQGPGWAAHLGRVRLTGCYAYGDAFGDQTSYLATFAYDDEAVGGPEHAVVALVDHNIGIAKDVFVSGPAHRLLDEVRRLCDADELMWFRTEEPGRLRAEVARHLAVTDELGALPGDSSLSTDRVVAGARLALLPAADLPPLPEPPAPSRATLMGEFLAAPEAAELAGLAEFEAAARDFCLSLLLDHADTLPDGDPLRFSPAVAELLLLDWVHRRAVLDAQDAAMLPRVARAWGAYAARLRQLPPSAAAQVLAAVDGLAPRFAELYRTGERRSPAAAAVAQLIADGVDPGDSAAIDAWLAANRDRLAD